MYLCRGDGESRGEARRWSSWRIAADGRRRAASSPGVGGICRHASPLPTHHRNLISHRGGANDGGADEAVRGAAVPGGLRARDRHGARADRDRAAQPRRADHARRRRAFPVQPLQRPGDHHAAVVRAVAQRAGGVADREGARAEQPRGVRGDRRRLAPALDDRGAGEGARGGAGGARRRGEVVRGDAVLAAVHLRLPGGAQARRDPARGGAAALPAVLDLDVGLLPASPREGVLRGPRAAADAQHRHPRVVLRAILRNAAQFCAILRAILRDSAQLFGF